jgi:spoIIIJ-associated protein
MERADQVERSAGSVEEAIEAALAELGIGEQEAEVEVVQEPKSGFLGFNSQLAVVRVRRAVPPQEEPEDLEEQADTAADFVEGLLDAMGIEAEVDIATEQGITYVEVWGKEDSHDMGLLIGKHGLTLDSLQEVVRSVVQRELGVRCRVVVDVEDYRKRRRSQLVKRATEAARRVRKSGRPERLEAMRSFDRKIVHEAVVAFTDLATASEGEEPDRRVVIRRK